MLQRLKQNDFDSVYKIMEESFPIDEHRPYQEQRELLEKPEYQIYIMSDETSKRVKGFLATWQFDEMAFIEHFAVDSTYRNEGIGTAMLQEIQQVLKGNICLEVELPDNELASRRIDFYKRNGFCFNEYPYIQPAISAGRNPIPLRIMTSGREVSEMGFYEIRKLLYEKVYQCPVRDI